MSLEDFISSGSSTAPRIHEPVVEAPRLSRIDRAPIQRQRATVSPFAQTCIRCAISVVVAVVVASVISIWATSLALSYDTVVMQADAQLEEERARAAELKVAICISNDPERIRTEALRYGLVGASSVTTLDLSGVGTSMSGTQTEGLTNG